MASSSTIQIIDDDDDEFDWEAAVEEIDMACQTTINPNYSTNTVLHKPPPIATKQSTLDKFIAIPTPKPPLPHDSNNRNSVVVEQGDASCIKIDPEAAKTWIYPVNVPLRDYQFAITKTCLFSNTLVTLPTGLGKTLIAAVVMYNYFRWFPEGKIVFTAPSKPLVMQQIEACHNIVGIPQEWTIDLTGEMSPIKRVSFWEAKRVFFVTPQVLEKDIESGKCLVERIVCLVIDEAHRATGNYSYCVVVRKLMADNVQLRILALTATPGSIQQTTQKIIDNLQLSTLEYRDESDHDVVPYVNEKKIELIKVAMGQDVVDVDKVLSEVMGRYCKKLCSLGVLRNSDFQTLSPLNLLALMTRFREDPPGNVPSTRHGEISGDIGLLLKLVHIRKLLTGYGIGPALEMLEENLKQGKTFNRLKKNEAFQKFKILMQQSVCSGSTSPKLSKMLEVLIDHFTTSDPLNSRVIIFSSYRGSVRAIMDALANIGHIVRATQFIGQSSGKTSKGQSQKIQQEVLQKFRAGGYNVIVATAIGEEGLDIMEVDLVLCFDANVSPLRMVQRMGRTGRHHKGRVVVLACEGPEYNSYLRKQKLSKNLHKHLRNGGRTSFNFYTSPRMVPHIYKPEVQYVELSIKQFVPRGKKVLDDHTIQLPTFDAKLNENEIEILRKFFLPKDNVWRPSLIAFPHFQAFPSRVHNIMHSFRSEMLIDTMQYLQGSSYLRDSKACSGQVEAISDLSASIETAEQHDSIMNEMQTFHELGNEKSQREVSESHVSPLNPPKTEKRCFTRSQGANTSVHSYLFGSDFVSIDVCGRVLVLSVPLSHLKDVHSKCTRASTAGLQNCYKQDAVQVGNSLAECGIETKRAIYFNARPTVSEGNDMVDIEFSDSDSQQGRPVDVDFKVCQTPICSRKLVEEETSEALPVGENRTALILSDDSGNDVEVVELSPRLTSLLKSGVVPESPTNDTGTSDCKWNNGILSQDQDSTSKVHTEPILYHPVISRNDVVIQNNNAGELPSCANDEIPSYAINGNNVSAVKCAVSLVMEEIETPAENPLHNSCSEEWHFTSGDNSESVKNRQKFKRLRKYGDLPKKCSGETNEYESIVDAAELGTSTCSKAHKRSRGEKKLMRDVRVFIEEQAEVSGEIPVSEDDDEQENSSYNDSFIDDRINPTAGCISGEDSGRDMMAIYRRSLLSQSPMGRLPITFMDGSPDSLVNRTEINYSGTSEGTNYSLRTPEAGLCPESTGWYSASSRLKTEKNAESMFCKSNDIQKEDKSIVGSHKRKLSSCLVGPLPVQNLEGKFLLQYKAQAKDLSHPDWMNKDTPVTTDFDDDQFYDGIDLDALEEQATKYLRSKSSLSMQNQMKNPDPQNHAALQEEPSFDLGI